VTVKAEPPHGGPSDDEPRPRPRSPAALYRRYCEAIRGEPLPLAFVDLDALEHNVDALVALVRARGKTLRVASKSVRCAALLRAILARGGAAMRGIMAFSPAEACFLAREGFADILVAYPTALSRDARLVAAAVAEGATIALVADAAEHLAVASAAAAEAGVRLPVVVDVDVSYRPLGATEGGRARLHVGVRRSPLRDPLEVASFVERILADPHLAFGGVQAYEAHLAGIPDDDARAPVVAGVKRVVKGLSREPVREQRQAIARELGRRGIAVPLFNGGGTGSVAWSAEDPALSEVAAGSGFLDSHLFDGFRDLALEPAAFFALQVTRRPGPGLITCHSGGFVASGEPGPDRLPRPWLPEGLALLDLEGAGEVQTPLVVPPGLRVELGDPVFFRHAKAGELAEHFAGYALVRGARVEARVPTYRGAGCCFH
jgi:D-serine deaminase-like pyridoxal phosphate-dependent protein